MFKGERRRKKMLLWVCLRAIEQKEVARTKGGKEGRERKAKRY